MHFFSLGLIIIRCAFYRFDRHPTESASGSLTSAWLDQFNAFCKDSEVMTFKPRNGIIECEDLGTVRGLNGDLGGVEHI